LDVAIQVARADAALRFLLCAETIQPPPPRHRWSWSCRRPRQRRGGGDLARRVLNTELNRVCPYQEGPTSMSVLVAVFLRKPALNTVSVDTDFP